MDEIAGRSSPITRRTTSRRAFGEAIRRRLRRLRLRLYRRRGEAGWSLARGGSTRWPGKHARVIASKFPDALPQLAEGVTHGPGVFPGRMIALEGQGPMDIPEGRCPFPVSGFVALVVVEVGQLGVR